MIGIINTIVCCTTLIGISIVDAVEEPSLWDTFETWEFFDLDGFFMAFNINVLSFCTILSLPNIYMEMAEKSRVKSLLYWGHVIPMIGKLVFMVMIFYIFQS